MNTSQELSYLLFTQDMEEFKRPGIRSEFSKYYDIKNGDIEKVRNNIVEIKAHYYEGKGKLSDDLLRNNQYHFAIGAGIIARVCIEGGMQHNTAYTLSDIYIRRGDKCRDPQEIIELTGTMMLDYAERMRELRKEGAVSLHVRRTVDYIYQNINEPLTLKMAADHEQLDPSYLSKLFTKEMGISIKAYILEAKIRTAQNILTFSDSAIADISYSLGFSSQSKFAASFKKITGVTPMQYRNMNSDEHSLHMPKDV